MPESLLKKNADKGIADIFLAIFFIKINFPLSQSHYQYEKKSFGH